VPPDNGRPAAFTYCAYGLTIRVPFACPALALAEAGAEPDVVVTEGLVPRALAAPFASDNGYDAEPGRFLRRGGRRAGRFLVEGGQATLQRNPQAEADVLARHFTDRVLAAVLAQHGHLVLHASAALTPTGVVAIAGETGAGKSTTLAALLERGCLMVSDDVTALRLTADGSVEVVPGTPLMHLTEQAADDLGLDLRGVPRQPWRRMKAAVPTEERMATSAAPLRAIYHLDIHEGDDIRVTALTGMAKFAAIQACMYGPTSTRDHPALFPLAAAAAALGVFELRRPRRWGSVDEVVDAVLGPNEAAVP